MVLEEIVGQSVGPPAAAETTSVGSLPTAKRPRIADVRERGEDMSDEAEKSGRDPTNVVPCGGYSVEEDAGSQLVVVVRLQCCSCA